jgi:hypothetical protein
VTSAPARPGHVVVEVRLQDRRVSASPIRPATGCRKTRHPRAREGSTSARQPAHSSHRARRAAGSTASGTRPRRGNSAAATRARLQGRPAQAAPGPARGRLAPACSFLRTYPGSPLTPPRGAAPGGGPAAGHRRAVQRQGVGERGARRAGARRLRRSSRGPKRGSPETPQIFAAPRVHEGAHAQRDERGRSA